MFFLINSKCLFWHYPPRLHRSLHHSHPHGHQGPTVAYKHLYFTILFITYTKCLLCPVCPFVLTKHLFFFFFVTVRCISNLVSKGHRTLIFDFKGSPGGAKARSIVSRFDVIPKYDFQQFGMIHKWFGFLYQKGTFWAPVTTSRSSLGQLGPPGAKRQSIAWTAEGRCCFALLDFALSVCCQGPHDTDYCKVWSI